MSALQVVALVIQASILLTVFGIGLSASPADVLHVLERPARLLRAMLAMFVVMPVLAVLLDELFELRPAIEVALVALAISPIPPLLPRRQGQAGDDTGYGVGLMVTMAVLSVALVPLAVRLLGLIFGREFSTEPGAIALMVLKAVVAPLVLGMLCRRLLPGLADRLRKPAGMVGNVLLTLAGLVILFAARGVLGGLLGSGTLLALAGFVAAGLAVGHWLGGPEAHGRTVLALANACRHPGIALAVAGANFPGDQQVTGAILLYLVVNIVVCMPYVKWRQRHAAGP